MRQYELMKEAQLLKATKQLEIEEINRAKYKEDNQFVGHNTHIPIPIAPRTNTNRG